MVLAEERIAAAARSTLGAVGTDSSQRLGVAEENLTVLDELGSREGFREHVSRHARSRAIEETNDVLDLFLERVDVEVDVLAPLTVSGRLRHELARAVVLVDGSRTRLRRATALEEAT